ncbi:MAG: ATP-binding protein [Archangium sp.]|nr:ATP-binding protein [Archangium sp.]
MHAVKNTPRPLALWLLASLPFIPLVLVFWAYSLPRGADDAVMPLAGQWEGHVADPGFDPFSPAADWTPLRLPGGFTPQGLEGEHLFVRRHFTALPGIVGHDSVFVIGSVRGATLRLFFNGETIGLKGEPASRFIGVEAGAEAFFVPAKLVRPGENTLTIEVLSVLKGRDGITDPRLLFGRHDVLGPWSLHEQQVRSVLEQGSLLLIAFLGVLLVALWVLQGERTNKDIYRSTLILLVAAGGYLLGKSGFIVSAILGSKVQMLFIVVSVHLLGLGIVEFVEAYYLQRATWFRTANRVVTLAAIVLTATGAMIVYRLYINWLFIMVLLSLGLAVRDLVKRITLFGPLVAVATLIVAGSGISDLLGDLDLIYAPRLFTFAVANLAAMSGAVVVAEFVQLARENTRLSASLQLRAEELAAALVKAEEGSRIKSEFLANTSHELRTPLNAIINIPQGLLEQFHEVRRARCSACGSLFELEEGEGVDSAACPSCNQHQLTLDARLAMDLGPEETSRLLKSIVRSGNHLLAVVNDILDYSKLEAGRVVLHREKVTAALLLEDLRLAMDPVATRAGVKLVIDDGAPGVALDADRVKLSQVLINLLGNAIKFSDGKGTVTVRAALQGGGLALSVRDEGIGIAPEHQALIFEGFRQVEGSNTRRFGGSGLGLAISKRLVVMHGGTLSVQSAPGAGSTFIVELPLIAPAEAAPDFSDAQVVLVVDDEAVAVDTTTVALRPLGCRVVAVQDPREAIARLRASRPSLLILDVMMPRISGLELLRQLQGDPDLASIPVLVSSAYPDNQRAAEALGATFIAKPWRAGELLRVASSLLARVKGPAT